MRNVMRLVSELMPIKKTVERPSGTLTIMMTYIPCGIKNLYTDSPLRLRRCKANINFEI